MTRNILSIDLREARWAIEPIPFVKIDCVPITKSLPIAVSKGFLTFIKGALCQRTCSNLLWSMTARIKENDNICIPRQRSVLPPGVISIMMPASPDHLFLVEGTG